MAQRPNQQPAINVDPSKLLGQWFVFPDSLAPNGRFRGFEDRDNESQLRGAFVLGQNMTLGGADLPTLRNGYEPIGTESSDAYPVTRAWTFETRNGDIFELKAFNDDIYYFLIGVSTEFALLKSGFTANLDWGYGNIGETAGDFHTWFCNGTDAWQQFNGAYGYISSTTVNTIVLTDTIANTLFYSAAGTVIINGTVYTYTGSGGSTLTGVTPDPTGEANGTLVVQQPRAVTFTAAPAVSSVITAHDGRLHARSDLKKSVWNYSKLDDPDNWTTGSSDGDGGTKDVELGGPLVAYAKLNKTLLALKNRIIKTLTFQQFGSRLDAPYYQTLVSVDDKGTTLGAVNQKSTFSTPFGIVFVTPDKRMMLLTGVTANNEPQYLCLSDPIQPVFTNGVHDNGTGIFVDGRIYYAFKENSNSTSNDTVLVGNMLKQTFDRNGRIIPVQWDTPIVGWNVADWTAVPDEAGDGHEVHFHSSLNSSSYRVISDKVDNTNPFTAVIRTWAENFGMPVNQKTIDGCFVEIRMPASAEPMLTLLYDEDGYTGTMEYVLDGDRTQNKFNSTSYNPFGANPFGYKKFGGDGDDDNLKTYRFDLEVPSNLRFFTLSLQLSADNPGDDLQLVRFGYRLKEIIKERDIIYRIGPSSE